MWISWWYFCWELNFGISSHSETQELREFNSTQLLLWNDFGESFHISAAITKDPESVCCLFTTRQNFAHFENKRIVWKDKMHWWAKQGAKICGWPESGWRMMVFVAQLLRWNLQPKNVKHKDLVLLSERSVRLWAHQNHTQPYNLSLKQSNLALYNRA